MALKMTPFAMYHGNFRHAPRGQWDLFIQDGVGKWREKLFSLIFSVTTVQGLCFPLKMFHRSLSLKNRQN